MSVRHLLAGLILAVIAVPALADAPHAREPKGAPGTLVLGGGSRVFARADGTPETLAQASPSASPSAASSAPGSPGASGVPTASPTPASLGAAEAEFLAFQSGKIDRTHYNAEFSAALTDAKLAPATAALKAVGTFKSITQLERADRDGLIIYIYRIRGSNGSVKMLLALDKTGKYAGVSFGADPG